jgi:CPA1 family monovalent cation:H+ antiporter
VAFGAYICAETVSVSGVMAVIVAGIVVGNYGMRGMSPSTRLGVVGFWDYAAFVVNSIVFLLIGIEVTYVDWSAKVAIACAAIAIAMIGRSSIYPLALVVDRLGARTPSVWRHVFFWGGLRGALSMALVLGLPQAFPERDAMVAATFAVVTFSLLAQGLTIEPLLRRLGIAEGPRSSTRTPENERELRRMRSDMVAHRAALEELDRFRATESHPSWAVELLARDYRKRLAGLEEAVDALDPAFADTERIEAARARRLALAAEKTAYLDAKRDGWLDEEQWSKISARIDAEVLAVQTDPHEG